MSAFDKIAKSAPSAPGKKSSVIAAVVPKSVAKSIDEYVTIKTSIKSEEADLKVLETQIIECLREQQVNLDELPLYLYHEYKTIFLTNILQGATKIELPITNKVIQSYTQAGIYNVSYAY
jgi:hypothetical protein